MWIACCVLCVCIPLIFYFFKDQIKDAYDNIINMIVGKKVEEPKKAAPKKAAVTAEPKLED